MAERNADSAPALPLSERLRRILSAEADGQRLGLSRVMVGAAAAVKAGLMWEVLGRVLESGRLRVPFVDWMPAPPVEAVPWLVGLWMAAAVAFAAGWRTPFTGGILMAVMGYVLTLDQQLYSNHLYLLLVVVFLLTVGRAGRCVSVDARWRGAAGGGMVPRWPMLLLRLQLSIVYGFAALSKINGEYLSGAVLRKELAQEGAMPVPEAWLSGGGVTAMAAGAIGIELFLATVFWLPRWRGAAALAGLVFHLGLIVMMGRHVTADLGVFAMTMCSLYLLFFEPQEAAAGRPPSPRLLRGALCGAKGLVPGRPVRDNAALK